MKKESLKKNLKWLICGIAILIFLLLLEDVFEYDILQLDNVVANSIIGIRSDILTIIATIITNFCNTIFVIALTILILIILKDFRMKKYICVNLIVIILLNNLLKILISRPRPEFKLIEETGFSFPSGHSMTAMAFYGLLIYFIWKYVKRKNLRLSLVISLSLLVLLIGLSRIYLGVHYTSDVIAGFSISLAHLIVYISIMENRQKKSKIS